jgi:hypothetical protein
LTFTPTPDTINLNSSKYEIILHLLVNDDTLFVSGDNMDGHLTGARPLPLKDESGGDFNMSNPPGVLTNETDVDVNMQNSSVSTFKPPMSTQPPVDQHYGLIKLEDIVESEADEHQQTQTPMFLTWVTSLDFAMVVTQSRLPPLMMPELS